MVGYEDLLNPLYISVLCTFPLKVSLFQKATPDVFFNHLLINTPTGQSC